MYLIVIIFKILAVSALIIAGLYLLLIVVLYAVILPVLMVRAFFDWIKFVKCKLKK